jgi:uncharacterized BrkB/YihY/UPF0761 family membrane protein
VGTSSESRPSGPLPPAAAAPEPPDSPAPESGGHFRALKGGAAKARKQADDTLKWFDDRRDTSRSVGIVFTAYEQDRDAGGGLMAGALAYRMFLWTLPAALVGVAGLGFLSLANSDDPARAVRDIGITSIPAQSIDQAAQNASQARWLALIVGVVLLYMASIALIRALWTVHMLVWRTPGVRPRSRTVLVGKLLLICVVVAGLTSLTSLIRDGSTGFGVLAVVLELTVYAVAWWAASTQLPHGNSSLWTLIPGALLFAVGVQGLQLFVVYYLAGHAVRASQLYGTLGVAAALLLGLYFVGRLIILSAELNRAVWARSATGRAALEAEPSSI